MKKDIRRWASKQYREPKPPAPRWVQVIFWIGLFVAIAWLFWKFAL